MYAIKENNKWKRTNLCSRFKGIGGFHLLTDEERAKHGFFRCIVVDEQYDIKTQSRSEEPMSWEFNEEAQTVTAKYMVVDKSSETIEAEEIVEKVKEAKAFLDKTDNREFPSYICKDGEILEETIAKRVEAREFIRANK